MSGAYFRAGIGACIVNPSGQVLACRRRDARDGAWQMPQGGIEQGEQPEYTLWRELAEEIGLGPEHLSLERELPAWIAYELPEAFRSAKVGLGQVQKWFLLRAQADVPVRPDGQEFSAWQWLAPDLLVRNAVSFRQPVYAQVFAAFALSPDSP